MEHSEDVYLSIVVPCYNEADRIGETLKAFQVYCSTQTYSTQIIVVNDGSKDGTDALVREQFPQVDVVSYPKNRGKGYAVRQGIGVARGKYRVVYDADGSTPISDVEKMWPAFEGGAAVVIGSRALAASDVQVPQPWHRRKMGRIYNGLLRFWGLTSFRDTQCGFKGFTTESCDVIFPLQRANGFGADIEILHIAEKHGLAIAEIPVVWINSEESRVNVVVDSFRMLCEMLVVRVRSWLGQYD